MVGERIKQARLMRGLSQRELARRAGLSPTAISKFEREDLTPSSPTLLSLARALELPVEFFVRPISIQKIQPAFRKRTSLPKKMERALLAKVKEWLERYLEAETIVFGRPQPFVFPQGFPCRVTTMDDVEEAALALRQAWNLGQDPISSLVQLLEDRNVKIGAFDSDQSFDACTFTADGEDQLLVMVIRAELPGDRTRFNLAHELGHVLLEVAGGLDPEQVSSRFAAAFLAPKPAVFAELGRSCLKLGLYELLLLKHKYGLSMQAWIYRAKDLGIIPDTIFRNLCTVFRARGWHKKEPGDPYPPEEPVRLKRLVLKALEDGLISEKRAAELLGMPVAEFQAEVVKVAAGSGVGLRHG